MVRLGINILYYITMNKVRIPRKIKKGFKTKDNFTSIKCFKITNCFRTQKGESNYSFHITYYGLFKRTRFRSKRRRNKNII